MASVKPTMFARLADGTLLLRQKDGTFKATEDRTDRARLKRWTPAEIERMAATDADHPRLDDAFWESVDQQPRKEAISIKLDADVLEFFRANGRGYQTRINAVLRRYMRARRAS